MSYDVLNINKERDLCSVVGKQTWDEVNEQINILAKEMHLSSKEVEALKQRKMAALRYAELKKENEYLSKGLGEDTKNIDILSQRKINKNKLEMQRMSKVYANNAQQTSHTEPKLNQKTNELARKKMEQQQKKQKTGK